MAVKDQEQQTRGRRALFIRGFSGLVLVSMMAAGVFMMLHGDPDPPKRVNEIQITMIVPPPPPPPPPEPKTEPPPPEEKKFEEQQPINDELEDKPIEKFDEAALDLPSPDMSGPPDLGLNSGPGTGGLQQGRGSGGGGTGGNGRFAWYASMVQVQMQSALQANDKTRYASVRLVVRLWLDNSGRVSRVALNGSTGDTGLDAAIRDEALGQLQLKEPPPQDMPMPIILRVTAQNT